MHHAFCCACRGWSREHALRPDSATCCVGRHAASPRRRRNFAAAAGHCGPQVCRWLPPAAAEGGRVAASPRLQLLPELAYP